MYNPEGSKPSSQDRKCDCPTTTQHWPTESTCFNTNFGMVAISLSCMLSDWYHPVPLRLHWVPGRHVPHRAAKWAPWSLRHWCLTAHHLAFPPKGGIHNEDGEILPSQPISWSHNNNARCRVLLLSEMSKTARSTECSSPPIFAPSNLSSLTRAILINLHWGGRMCGHSKAPVLDSMSFSCVAQSIQYFLLSHSTVYYTLR